MTLGLEAIEDRQGCQAAQAAGRAANPVLSLGWHLAGRRCDLDMVTE